MASKKSAPAEKPVPGSILPPIKRIATIRAETVAPGATADAPLYPKLIQKLIQDERVAIKQKFLQTHYDDYDYNDHGYGSTYSRAEREREEKIKKMQAAIEILQLFAHERKYEYNSAISELPGFIEQVFHHYIDMERRYKRAIDESSSRQWQNDILQKQIEAFAKGPTVVPIEGSSGDRIDRARAWCSQHVHQIVDAGKTTHFIFADQKMAATFKLLFG